MSDATPVLAPARYSCPVCGRPAADLAEKKAHVRLNHPRPKKVRRG